MSSGAEERPGYDEYRDMAEIRGPRAEALARQALVTSQPWLTKPWVELDVLDVGSGYGHIALALGQECGSVVGLEPAASLHTFASDRARESGVDNVTFEHGTAEGLVAESAYDLVVLDNVYEHLPDQPEALRRITRALRPGGVLYIVVPNKLWPIEAHYGLPFLSWLPLRVANAYLKASRRGTDYSDASYAPTYWQLRRALGAQGDLDYSFTLPGIKDATIAGTPIHYRFGMWLLERAPAMWSISKALVVVAVKSTETTVRDVEN